MMVDHALIVGDESRCAPMMMGIDFLARFLVGSLRIDLLRDKHVPICFSKRDLQNTNGVTGADFYVIHKPHSQVTTDYTHDGLGKMKWPSGMSVRGIINLAANTTDWLYDRHSKLSGKKLKPGFDFAFVQKWNGTAFFYPQVRSPGTCWNGKKEMKKNGKADLYECSGGAPTWMIATAPQHS